MEGGAKVNEGDGGGGGSRVGGEGPQGPGQTSSGPDLWHACPKELL